ncbi:MAG: AmmeMemoRadiSam system radical SAM enzyme [Omnitrophica bacterium RBG_13_46_9]|nr:MAG: AmmeMemoRadiSam system radical SAM enzyme [Omnitrophica bacterium RBG_13_46_9]
MPAEITRRQFIKNAFLFCATLMSANLVSKALRQETVFAATGYDKEALYYNTLDKETVICLLCPRQCVLKNGQRSFCKVREPRNGKLYTLVYELSCSAHVDPIEKKPIYHMLPGSKSFSIATAGCNLRCKFCQNWQISQEYPENTSNRYLSCEDVVRFAIQNSCRSIAYTYSEPTIFYEYMLNTARIAKAQGIKNIWVTAGVINPAPLTELCNVIDAANIDLKGFSDTYLQEVCDERLQPLLNAIKLTKQSGVWVEITNLIVPTLNDDMQMISDMCAWIKENLGGDTPLHFSRFWPMYKLKNLPPTPVETLKTAKQIAEEAGLNYVYIGNVPGEPGSNTHCPNCKKTLIERVGYFVLENNIVNSKCKFCGRGIAGVWG